MLFSSQNLRRWALVNFKIGTVIFRSEDPAGFIKDLRKSVPSI
ncbi:MAG: hypothetical protein R6U35_00425 [Candidatus Humimicrobiaceae bacterium]